MEITQVVLAKVGDGVQMIITVRTPGAHPGEVGIPIEAPTADPQVAEAIDVILEAAEQWAADRIRAWLPEE